AEDVTAEEAESPETRSTADSGMTDTEKEENALTMPELFPRIMVPGTHLSGKPPLEDTGSETESGADAEDPATTGRNPDTENGTENGDQDEAGTPPARPAESVVENPITELPGTEKTKTTENNGVNWASAEEPLPEGTRWVDGRVVLIPRTMSESGHTASRISTDVSGGATVWSDADEPLSPDVEVVDGRVRLRSVAPDTSDLTTLPDTMVRPATGDTAVTDVTIRPATEETTRRSAGRSPVPTERNPKYHRIVAGDTLTGISVKYFGDATHTGQIFQLNRDRLTSEKLLPIGVRIRLR
ncbi:MAG: hypothetical protein Q4C47_00320, partial [Planctomycetia bacterium]|nr:hypothetical protein [Planctomycetia bacterium]